MKNKIFKAFAGLLVAALAITAVPAISAQAAEKNPSNDWWYIVKQDITVWDWQDLFNKDNDNTVQVKGITYNKKTNTLTLKNVNEPNIKLICSQMGDNFTVNVIGKNSIAALSVEANAGDDGWGGNLTITGDGTLDINKNKTMWAPLFINRGNNSEEVCNLKVEGTVALNIYSCGDGETVLDCPYASKFNVSANGFKLANKNLNSYKAVQTTNGMCLYPDNKIEVELLENPGALTGKFAKFEDILYSVFDLGDGNYWVTENWDENMDYFKPTGKMITAYRWGDDNYELFQKDGKKYAVMSNWDVDPATKTVCEIVSIDGLWMDYLKQVETFDMDTFYGESGYEEVNCEKANSYDYNAPITIKPVAKTTAKISADAKTIKATAKKVKGATTYQIKYSTKKNMSGAKTVDSKKTTITASNLKAGTYYVQVRAGVKTAAGDIAYGAWSNASTVVVK